MKALRFTLALVAATLLLVLLLAGGAWYWGGLNTSLATSLAQLKHFLPADQRLEVEGVQGSLRDGGSIASLRWQRGKLTVQANDVQIGWTPQRLFDGELHIGRIAIARLSIDDQSAATAPVVPTDLRLPFKVNASYAVQTLEWAGPPALRVTDLSGHYAFDGKEHRFDADKLQLARGSYRVQGSVQAVPPMALSVQLQGTVQTTVPSSQRNLNVQAQASLQGPLAGADAALNLQAKLLPELPGAQAMQASVSAHLQPWQAQTVLSAQAQWQALDLAALWPQAPLTLLTGEADITPAGQGWQAGVKLSNSRPGPWDLQRLPLDSLQAKLAYDAGQWRIEALQASAAGGRIEGQGRVSPPNTAGPHWQASASVHGIRLNALDSRLGANTLEGNLGAQQAAKGIAFELALQSAAQQAAPLKALAGLRLQKLQAKGLWQAPRLALEFLTLQADEARLEGRLNFDTLTQAADARLALTLPGGTALLDGQLSAAQGKGDLSLKVSDASLATRWLARLPGAPAALATSLAGAVNVDGHWNGGWQNQGRDLLLQASLRAPRMELAGATAVWRLTDLQADLSGALAAMELKLRGQAQNASLQLSLQAQAQAGRKGDGSWQASLGSAQFSAQDSLRPGLWTLQLNQTVALDWRPGASARSLDLGAGSASLTGPVPGAAAIQWQAARWSQTGAGAGSRSSWLSQGSLQGLPLAWLELAGRTRMANLGLRGDLQLAGQWEASGGEALRLRATLQRTSGDLQLLAEDSNLANLSAGVREARLSLTADGEQVAAKLRWDSERAGQAQADFSTRLQLAEGAWTWPLDAPLAGSLHAQLPPVGVWSLLAPPGWRLRGTLDADATLTGTRSAPLWRGNLQANDLAVRSVVDGIDFSKGRLRAQVDGQRLEISEFQLLGAGGSGGGQLSGTGSVLWTAADESTATAATALSRLHMALDVEAKGLRVSTRADQRLVVSGKLSNRLEQGRLTVRGRLMADQASFILPEDTAPALGDDVVVRNRNVAGSPGAAPTTAPAPGVRVQPDVAITLDLGPDFHVQGRGINTRLAGTLDLASTPERGNVPRLSGELRTVGGTYKAYGQQLDIEEGVLRFNGPYDNPALDILAIKPNLTQRVGVQVLGTALLPVVRLYSEPELADAEKLAWLLLGRSAANGGAEAAVLQQAALALLGGKGRGLSGGVAQALGLDELSVRGASSVTSATGATSTAASVTLGKRVSRNFYVAYERSLAGTLGTFYIFYDLSRRFTVRAQTGEQSAIDLIFTLRYD